MNILEIKFKYISADIHDSQSRDEVEIESISIDEYKIRCNMITEIKIKDLILGFRGNVKSDT